jgi:hypothetical protein
MDPTARVVIGLAISVLCLIYLLPTFVVLLRDAAAKTEIVVLNVAFGWTGIGWLAAQLLAFGPRNSRPTAPSPPRPSQPAGPSVYRDGVYLVSSGPDSHTWAIREEGRWCIVYEIDGEERLTGSVRETDVPLSVLAAALEPEGRR